ncbi:MAG: two-component system, LuxR family, response regulator DctR [Pseudomonadota bacterium]|jgi:two-component system response regulator DctR|nr:two-component system, LuxR family, response regulator DctR [Pseudomonadota bacterium]MDQ5903511.1 two-component system, LuxR family, response regulator DctR [Pseudomonadota bacterium]MDQ5906105.1 two-component system, LuxR family, response regulator DctR [Pseudomonadota bacterium]MDQ5914304.1 two-component system, LuxR family, response regulator DctR [Pseudomonadota bacterium]MDQ5916974.1 two-component system, LuxR family, response regulator DctR [Pseudomonadota bacterium]
MTHNVHLVDDDEAIRDALGWLLESRGLSCKTYPSGESFLAAWTPELTGCLLLDIRMHGMSGLELFDRLLERGNLQPVIFLTGHGDVPMAVSALKKGAFDFVEKPFDDNELVNRVLEAQQLDRNQRASAASSDTLNSRLEKLTSREKQVMELILAGKFNKVIADELNISMRTVEVHRANLFEKMGVRTAVELSQMMSSRR